ncbi:AMP-binding protein [Desulfocurvibacter africanus]|uniref:Long-chain-fatty-acid--CoA ligase n=1 Tax=Desulfocurvibacter africanus subsp. africanus str. Walvis Bay TaxID=690850 RepID=F3YZ27_DESAF|nr:AMP-binding protein [Desulfocurvibacter africanus]EGJ49672.1 Long-chain-fatty-acid--CoA ligase [Desulfocurvibacter africanus subsp. africanus str. Walvis Bay]
MDEQRTLVGKLAAMADRGDKPAIIAFGEKDAETISFAELDARTGRVAASLSARGLDRHAVVAFMAEPSPAFMTAALGVLRAGLVVCPMDAQLSGGALEHVLQDSGAVLVFADRERAEKLRAHGKTPEIVLLDAPASEPRSLAALTAKAADRDVPPFAPADPDNVAALFYTSGTTGRPKGVPLTHGNVSAQLQALVDMRLFNDEDRMLTPLPMHHVYPFVLGFFFPLSFGMPVILPYGLTGPELVRAMSQGQVSVIAGVPRLYKALVDGIEAKVKASGALARMIFGLLLGLSMKVYKRTGIRLGKLLFGSLNRRLGGRVRFLASGGSLLDPELGWKLEGLGLPVAIGYGLTETSPLLASKQLDSREMDSVGVPLPGVELRIGKPPRALGGDEEARACAGGEIQARGPGVFKGYLHLPDKTAEAFTEDGWFRTGDLGCIDDKGILRLTGRASTLIVTQGGENVQPDEVEEACESHEYIRECGVVERGGSLAALVVPDLNALRKAGEGDLREAVRRALAEIGKRLPSYKRLADFAITREPLPRTRLGKIRRHILEQLFDRAKSGDAEAMGPAGPMDVSDMGPDDQRLLENDAARTVWLWLAERFPDRRLTPDTSPSMDLGIDSLEWLNVTMVIRERTGVDLSEEAIGRIETVRDLLSEVRGHASQEQAGPVADPIEQPLEVLSDTQKRWLKPLPKSKRILALLMSLFVKTVFYGFFRMRVSGRENVPTKGPFVIAPNHESFLDAFAVAAALGYRRSRLMYWAGWTGIAFRNKFFRFVSRLGQAVPIDPTSGIRASLAFAAAVLSRGDSLGWFPEGRRTRDGYLQSFKPGLGMVLARYPTTVVPVAINGAYEAMPPNKAFPRLFTPISLTFGKPMTPRELMARGKGNTEAERMMDGLRQVVKELGNLE